MAQNEGGFNSQVAQNGAALDDILQSTKGYVDYMKGKKVVTTLTGLPSDVFNIVANVTAATNFTHDEMIEGYSQQIRVNNTTAAAITQSLPTTGIYQSMVGSSVSIPANSFIEISLWMIDGKIVIRIGENA